MSSAPGSGPQAASSVRLSTECRRGPCKRRASISTRSGWPVPAPNKLVVRHARHRPVHSVMGATRDSTPGKASALGHGVTHLAGRPAEVLISGLGKVGDWSGREFQRREAGAGPGRPGLRGENQRREGASRRTPSPTGGACRPLTPARWPGCTAFCSGSLPCSGRGEICPALAGLTTAGWEKLAIGPGGIFPRREAGASPGGSGDRGVPRGATQRGRLSSDKPEREAFPGLSSRQVPLAVPSSISSIISNHLRSSMAGEAE